MKRLPNVKIMHGVDQLWVIYSAYLLEQDQTYQLRYQNLA